MARITAPMLSFGASGQIAKSMVFSKWKGIDYARKYTIPANPNTTNQQTTRGCFKWVHDMYKYLDPAVVEAWVAYAQGKPMTGGNAFASKNVTALRGQTDNLLLIAVPAVLGGPPPATNTSSGGTAKVTVVGTAPTLPTGWSVVHAILFAMKKQAPTGEKEPNPSLTATVNSPGPYTHDFTGLTAADHYVAEVGFKYLRADGKFAYGGSTNVDCTVT